MEQLHHLTVQFVPPGSDSTLKDLQTRRKSRRVSFGAGAASPEGKGDGGSKSRKSEDKSARKKHKSEKRSKESNQS